MAEDDLKITVSPQQFSIDVMLEKYAKGDETRIDDIYRRVARGVAMAEPEARRKQVETEFFENFQRGALGAGRIISAAGTGIQATLINCFVQPVGDAIQGVDEDGLPGIYVALLQAAEPCGAAAAWVTTFPRSVRRVHACIPRDRRRRDRAVRWMFSMRHAGPLKAPGRGAARRWAFWIAHILTCLNLSRQSM